MQRQKLRQENLGLVGKQRNDRVALPQDAHDTFPGKGRF